MENGNNTKFNILFFYINIKYISYNYNIINLYDLIQFRKILQTAIDKASQTVITCVLVGQRPAKLDCAPCRFGSLISETKRC